MEKFKKYLITIILIYDLISVLIFINNFFIEIKNYMKMINVNFEIMLLLIGIITTIIVFFYYWYRDSKIKKDYERIYISAHLKLIRAYLKNHPNAKIDPIWLKEQDISRLELELLDFPESEIYKVLNQEPFNPII